MGLPYSSPITLIIIEEPKCVCVYSDLNLDCFCILFTSKQRLLPQRNRKGDLFCLLFLVSGHGRCVDDGLAYDETLSLLQPHPSHSILIGSCYRSCVTSLARKPTSNE